MAESQGFPSMDKLAAKIENWSVVDNLIFHGFRKLEPGQRLTGYLMGHTDLPNGVIYTSVIQSVDLSNSRVETTNSVYHLGHMNEAYEVWATEQREMRSADEIPAPTFAPAPRKPVTAYPGAIPAFRQG